MTTYARRLGLFSGTMAVVGGIIGGGIFRTPATVAERLGSREAVPAIVFLAASSYVGVRPAAITQNIFTILKLTALATLVGAGLLLAAPSPPSAAPSPPSAGLGAALVPILFTYGGWQQTNFIAE